MSFRTGFHAVFNRSQTMYIKNERVSTKRCIFFRPAKVAASTTDKYNVFADAFKEDPFSTTSPFNSNSNSSDPFKPSSEDPFGGATTGINGVPDDPFGAGANDPFKSSTTDPFASNAFSNQSGAFSFFFRASIDESERTLDSVLYFSFTFAEDRRVSDVITNARASVL